MKVNIFLGGVYQGVMKSKGKKRSSTQKRLSHASRDWGDAPPRLSSTPPKNVWVSTKCFDRTDLVALLRDQIIPHASLYTALNRIADDKPLGKAVGVIAGYGQHWTARNPFRWDATLSQQWILTAYNSNPAFRLASEQVHGARAALGCPSARITWHAMLVRPGSPDQEVHIDGTGRGKCYYTYVVPLMQSPEGGGTYFPEAGLTFRSVGRAILFGGDVHHKGLGNRSAHDRIFLYAAMHSGPDPNA